MGRVSTTDWKTAYIPPFGNGNIDLLPELFGIGTVAFKAGTEYPWLNRTLHCAAAIRMRTGVPSWESFVPIVRAMSWLAGFVGKDEGGAIFELGGFKNGSPVLHRLALMADNDGGMIPSVLAAILVGEVLTGAVKRGGLLPVLQWIEPPRLVSCLAKRGLRIWLQESPREGWVEKSDAQHAFWS